MTHEKPREMITDNNILPLLRLLYLPNELEEREQFGPRSVFEKMAASGELADYRVYSFLLEQRKRGGVGATLADLYAVAEEFRPNMILWQHPGDFAIPSGFGYRLKNIASNPILAYDERDVYGGNTKAFTPGMLTLALEADVVFLVGLGSYANWFRKVGAKRVCYSPSCIDTLRFGHPWDVTAQREFDVIMFGNLFRSTRMTSGIPGWKNRLRLAERLSELLGERFALYGRGWDRLPSARGELSFLKQEEKLRQGWLSVGWTHYDQTPFYFSNRLPIALMSGVAHVTNYQPGYEIMFENGKDLCYARTVDEMIDMVLYLLSLPRSRLIEMGKAGQQYAKANLSTEIVLRNLIRTSVALCERPDATG